MPFKSKAQQRYLHAAASRGEVPQKTVEEWDQATKKKPGGFKALPEKKAAMGSEAGGSQGSLGKPQPLPEILDISQYPGDLVLNAKQLIDDLDDDTVREMTLRFYLHDMLSDPSVQGFDHAKTLVQQHIMQMNPKKSQQAAAAAPALQPQPVPPGVKVGSSAPYYGRLALPHAGTIGRVFFRSLLPRKS